MALVNKPINCNQTGLTGQWTLVKDCLMVSVSIDLSGHDDGWVNVWETETLSTPMQHAEMQNYKIQIKWQQN